jgi:hypothetical protein
MLQETEMLQERPVKTIERQRAFGRPPKLTPMSPQQVANWQDEHKQWLN